jgi:predicted nuclease of predicted toxin-antitoxin system
MKIKLDENLPTSLVKDLSQLGHEVDTVPQERLTGRDDSVVWQAAQKAGRFLITQDLDFADIRSFQPGAHHGLLLVRLHEPGRRALRQHILNAFHTGNTDEWRGCFIVLTEHKLRIRRPPASQVRERPATYRVRRMRVGK